MEGSIIGSFRKYYSTVLNIIEVFENTGISILSPRKSNIVDPDEEFIILASDNPHHNAIEIQLIALHRILRSDFVYVYSPEGYIGRTTCYEIGRIVERKIPLYFSSPPRDLPIYLHSNMIWSPEDFINHLKRYQSLPEIGKSDSIDFAGQLHNDLFRKNYYE